jgi:hypothetical protein
MSEERMRVLRRFQERLAQLEAGLHKGPLHHKVFHLQNALNALESDHSLADLHLDEFDRAEIEREVPELAADRVPTVDELRARFDMIAGGML